MTGQALYYLGERGLQHKVLAIAEEQGAQKASYALKLLLSEGRLCIASTGKDPQSGKLITHEYVMQGPVMLIITTTAIEIDEELLNRCLVLCVDEGREQTQAIHQLQRKGRGLEGLWAREERSELLRSTKTLSGCSSRSRWSTLTRSTSRSSTTGRAHEEITSSTRR